MENTIEIQKEFEVLVSELNKLKKINQITSTNAENAERTINEIESFILAVNSFRQGVENDYKNKKEDADKVIDSLSLAIKTIIKNTEKHSDEFSKLFDGLSNNFVEETSKTHTKLIKQIEEYSEKLSDINLVNRENIEIFTKTAVEKINERELH
jgi:predicted DNA-binding protein